MTVLLFLAVLFVLILVHEWGHFIVAKKNGIRVDEFGIGFPPKLFGWKKGETEYTFNLLPIGGFVKIFGENAEDAAHDAAEGKDVSNSFVAKSKLVQAAVLVAGVTMNVIFAWFLFIFVFTLGVPTSVDESLASDEAKLVVADILPGSPAEKAGFTKGVEIVAVSSGELTLDDLKPTNFSAFAQAANDGMAVVTKMGEQEIVLEVSPETNVIADRPEVAAIGVSLTMVDEVSLPVHEALWQATLTTGYSLLAIVSGLFNLIVDSFSGTADFSQVTGPVGIVGLVGDAASFGLTSLLMFTAVISLNLAVINLFPFPALDGGRLLFVAIEAITRKQIKPIWVARVNMVGFALLLLLMVVVTYSDITKLF